MIVVCFCIIPGRPVKCLMVALFFFYGFAAFYTSVFAFVIAMLTHIHIMIALSAILAEVFIIL